MVGDTPQVVVKYGWYDEPYIGPDRCDKCFGWGTISTTVQSGVDFHRTCPECSGTRKSKT